MIVGAPTVEGELACGGVAMIGATAQRDASAVPLPGADGGTVLGKRYGNPANGLQLLCTKGGTGSLSFAGEVLEMIDAKRLPSSD